MILPPQASHRAGFFYFTTKDSFRWLTIKRIFPAEKVDEPTSTKAENEKLKKKNKKLSAMDEASHESVLKQLKDAKLQREYQEAVAVLERIPKEVLDAYTHMGTTERNHPMKQGL